MMNVLRERSTSLFAAVGGWRTVTEAVLSRLVFVVLYVVTGHVWTSALVAVACVFVFTVVRVCTGRTWWQVAPALGIVTVSAVLAGATGQGVDFYLIGVVMTVVAGLVVLVSMVIGLPLVGVVVGAVRGDRFAWRRDRAQRRRYQWCTAVFLAKFVTTGALLVPLYLTGQVVALGIATTLLTTPPLAACVYVCWRILERP
jgi:hypothetical protein